MNQVFVSVGEILWDLLPKGKQLGGAPTNVAFHVKNLGHNKIESYLISSVGNDALGQEIIHSLDKLEINSQLLNINHHYKTGTVTVSLDEHGVPAYIIDENVAWDFIPIISTPFLKNVDAVYFGTLAQRAVISQNSILNFLSELPASTLKVVDINLRQSFYNRDVIEKSLQLADVIKLNDEELNIISKLFKVSGNEKLQLKTISQLFENKISILTKGNAGSIIYAEDTFSIHPGFKINPKDTVGAGDAFMAAIILGILKNVDLDTMNTYANQIASFICTQTGATAKIPKELRSLFK